MIYIIQDGCKEKGNANVYGGQEGLVDGVFDEDGDGEVKGRCYV